jgi:hypothetical protein
MFYVAQFTNENLYILDCSDTYDEALAIRQKLADERPSRWYEVIPEGEFLQTN